jgi:hypothetical protein
MPGQDVTHLSTTQLRYQRTTIMAKNEEKMDVYTCDAPECSTEVVAREGEIPAGFIGTTMFEHAGGGDVAEWFACTALHIRKAVVAVQLAGFSTNPALPKVKDPESTTTSGKTPGDAYTSVASKD